MCCALCVARQNFGYFLLDWGRLWLYVFLPIAVMFGRPRGKRAFDAHDALVLLMLAVPIQLNLSWPEFLPDYWLNIRGTAPHHRHYRTTTPTPHRTTKPLTPPHGRVFWCAQWNGRRLVCCV